jgi:hypothetical protein
MAGIAFVQNLAIRQLLPAYEINFIGADISPAEREFNLKHFRRGAIFLDESDEEIVRRIGEAVTAARAKLKPKRLTLDQLIGQSPDLLCLTS